MNTSSNALPRRFMAWRVTMQASPAKLPRIATISRKSMKATGDGAPPYAATTAGIQYMDAPN